MSDPSAAFVFVHGSCHGAWCWRDVIFLLRAQGYAARAINLPPYNADADTQVTLDAYAQAITADIDAHGGASVNLVGHSAGGYAITAAATLAPSKVARLVYICAYVPQVGTSLADLRRTADRQPIMDMIKMASDKQTFEFKPDKARAALFHDCANQVADDAMARLVPQPVAPQNVPVCDLDRASHISRFYVRCTKDRVIPPEEQVKMTKDWPENTVEKMSCGHSPFLADPIRLADILVSFR